MADEYIRKVDAVDALKALEEPAPTARHLSAIFDCEDAIKSIEPADVVSVIRCGQCKYWQDNDSDYGYCYAKDGHGFGHAWGKNDFCSYGKMR